MIVFAMHLAATVSKEKSMSKIRRNIEETQNLVICIIYY